MKAKNFRQLKEIRTAENKYQKQEIKSLGSKKDSRKTKRTGPLVYVR